ncbi:hypothetical protein QJV37_14175 [Listeria cossartiae subsp. cayugensis]|uniref:Uncharacterized protein n=1 Tax=Listeria cossartiae subsp. cayugensis TaxID=2713505 RepID=A0ABU2IRG6_9LIST|nr:hypothetical protein [Listeria cossartiae]MDT0115279.1 hypothetical protein [Listeria cossartiae subsp. cayugensis]
MEGVGKHVQVKSHMYRIAYWHAVSTVAKYFPNQNIKLELTKENMSYIFDPPKKLQTKTEVYSWEYIKQPFCQAEQRTRINYVLQNLGILKATYYLDESKEANSSSEQIFILDEAHGYHTYSPLPSTWELINDELFLHAKKCEPIKNALDNMGKEICYFVMADLEKIEKELNYLMLYYQPLLRECLLIS